MAPPVSSKGFLLQSCPEILQWSLFLFHSVGLQKAEKDGGAGLEALISAAGGSMTTDAADCKGQDPADWLVLGPDTALEKEHKWCQTFLGANWIFMSRNSFTSSIMQQSLEGMIAG